jgi:hypothetical protein
MQKSTDAIVKEVDDLVATGDLLVKKASHADSELEGHDLADVMMWISRVGQTIRRLYPVENSHAEIYNHAKRVEGFNFIHSNNYAHLSEIYGVARAIQHEIRSGLLLDLRRLLQADIFADFLDMAEHLLEEGYKDAAAVLVGGVLEDSLRKLAHMTNVATVDVNNRPMAIGSLNVALAKGGAYGALVQKQVTSWADLRNSAAHAHFDKYTKDDVKQMLQFVLRFCSDYLQ